MLMVAGGSGRSTGGPREHEASSSPVEEATLDEARQQQQPAHRQAARARGVDACPDFVATSLPGRGEPGVQREETLTAMLMAALPALFRAELPEASEEWLPSRDSLRYWTLEIALEGVEQLSLQYVAALIGPADPYADFVAAHLGLPNLGDALCFPVDADVDRLWGNPRGRRLFEEALRANHYVDIVDRACESRLLQLKQRCASQQQFSRVWETDHALRALTALRARLEASESVAWESLWAADRSAYPDWSFLMRVAKQRFR